MEVLKLSAIAKMTIMPSVHKKLQDARVVRAAQTAVKQTMYDLQKECMKEAPVDTGNLRRSHSVQINAGRNQVQGILSNNANYWVYVNFGTSKRSADAFLDRAFAKVEPNKKVMEHFKSNMGD